MPLSQQLQALVDRRKELSNRFRLGSHITYLDELSAFIEHNAEQLLAAVRESEEKSREASNVR